MLVYNSPPSYDVRNYKIFKVEKFTRRQTLKEVDNTGLKSLEMLLVWIKFIVKQI